MYLVVCHRAKLAVEREMPLLVYDFCDDLVVLEMSELSK